MAKPDSKDLIATLGLLLILVGVGRWSINTALIIAGLMLFYYAFVTSKPQPKQ